MVLGAVLTGCSFEAALGTSQPDVVADARVEVDAPDQPATPDAAPDAAPDAPPAATCAPTYVTVANTGTQSKYRRVQVQTAWATAKADCERDGGHLAVSETLAEAVALVTFVNPLASSPYIWAGISDPEQDNTWITVTGQPFTALRWGSDDPDYRTDEIYGIVDQDGDFYDWYDYGIQEYACECEP